MMNHNFETPNGLDCRMLSLTDKRARRIAETCEKADGGVCVSSATKDLFVVITVKLEKHRIHLVYYHPYSDQDLETAFRKIRSQFESRFHGVVNAAIYAVYRGKAHYCTGHTFGIMCSAVKNAVEPSSAALLYPQSQ
jgi:hypothetical protein